MSNLKLIFHRNTEKNGEGIIIIIGKNAITIDQSDSNIEKKLKLNIKKRYLSHLHSDHITKSDPKIFEFENKDDVEFNIDPNYKICIKSFIKNEYKHKDEIKGFITKIPSTKRNMSSSVTTIKYKNTIVFVSPGDQITNNIENVFSYKDCNENTLFKLTHHGSSNKDYNAFNEKIHNNYKNYISSAHNTIKNKFTNKVVIYDKNNIKTESEYPNWREYLELELENGAWIMNGFKSK